MRAGRLAKMILLWLLLGGLAFPGLTALGYGESWPAPSVDALRNVTTGGDPGAGLLAGGGSGAGDPWPGLVSESPTWRRERQPRFHSHVESGGRITLAWAAWDGNDSEIVLTLIDPTGRQPDATLRVTDNESEESTPLVLNHPEGGLGVAWEARRGPVSVLMYAGLDAPSRTLDEPRPLAILGRRVVSAALGLDQGGRPVVVLARRTRGGVELVAAESPRRLVPLAVTSAVAANGLVMEPAPGGALLLRWPESPGLEGILARDADGRWSTPLYLPRGRR